MQVRLGRVRLGQKSACGPGAGLRTHSRGVRAGNRLVLSQKGLVASSRAMRRQQTCHEVKRVLKPGGSFIVVTPGYSPILDLCVRVMTGASPKRDFQNRRQRVLPWLYREFVVSQRVDYPSFAHGARLYTALGLGVPTKNREALYKPRPSLFFPASFYSAYPLMISTGSGPIAI